MNKNKKEEDLKNGVTKGSEGSKKKIQDLVGINEKFMDVVFNAKKLIHLYKLYERSIEHIDFEFIQQVLDFLF